MKHRNAEEDVIDQEVTRYRDERKRTVEEDEEIKEALKRSQIKHRDESRVSDLDDEGSDDMNGRGDDSDHSMPAVTPQEKGRSRGQTSTAPRATGRGSRGGRGGRSKAPVVAQPSNSRNIKDVFASQKTNRRRVVYVATLFALIYKILSPVF